MPRFTRLLLASHIKNLAEGKTVAVGGVTGLYFRKSRYQNIFFLRYQDQTGRHDLSIGTYPEISLAQARDLAAVTRARISQGENVLEQRRQERQKLASRAPKRITRSFESVARAWVEERSKFNYWEHDAKGESRAIRILEMHVFPHIGKTNINKITVDDVFNVLSLIWTTKHSTASKAKTYIYKVFQWAIAKKMCTLTENPGDIRYSLGILMEPLKKRVTTATHFAACAVEEIPLFFVESARYDSMSARATEFAILTCSRSKAVRLATWDEIDFENRIWTVPVDHDKIKSEGRDRRIFLSVQAIALLKTLPRFPGSNVIFPNLRCRPLSDAALTMFLRGMHEARFAEDGHGWVDPVTTKVNGNPAVITLHGTARASFRTWAKSDELGNNRRFDQEAVELCLLHSKRDTYKGAYDRAYLEKERRLIMDAWGDYCWSMRGSDSGAL